MSYPGIGTVKPINPEPTARKSAILSMLTVAIPYPNTPATSSTKTH